jgi:hypothetical protein
MVGEDAQDCDADNGLGGLLMDETVAGAGQHSIFMKACSILVGRYVDGRRQCLWIHGLVLHRTPT